MSGEVILVVVVIMRETSFRGDEQTAAVAVGGRVSRVRGGRVVEVWSQELE